jgi:hypothetical protein
MVERGGRGEGAAVCGVVLVALGVAVLLRN